MKKNVKVHAVMRTSGGQYENAVPYVLFSMDVPKLSKRIREFKEMLGEKGAAKVSCWSDNIVEIEWLRQAPKEWLGKKRLEELEDTGSVFLTKDLTEKDLEKMDIARVDCAMTNYWDHLFTVSCIDKYSDDSYECSNPIYYDNFREIVDIHKEAQGKKK